MTGRQAPDNRQNGDRSMPLLIPMRLSSHRDNGTARPAFFDLWGRTGGLPKRCRATEQAPLCLIQIDAELDVCAVMAEKNAMRFQTS
jgi:hypothetical protein